ncbi:MAG: PLP-dependent aminotransferase family protein [Actinomycetota bacterium]
MAEVGMDPFTNLYAERARGMSASAVRALFAVASRPEVISFAGGSPYVRALPQERVMEAARIAIQERGDVALQYGGGQGHLGLREQLVTVMAAEGVAADPDHLVITEGAQQALDIIGKIFVDPGDLIAIEAPCYVGGLSAFSTYQPRYLQVPMDDDGMIVEALEEALIRGERPKFVYTVPNFHNPAGVTMSYERRVRLVNLCREAGIPIIEDNPYGMLRFEGDPVPTLRSMDPDNVIYLGTLSKVFAPGVRIGWILGGPGVIQRAILAKEAASLCSSHLTQLVSEEYLKLGDFREGVGEFVGVYRARRDAMLHALQTHFPADATWTHPAGGFYVWVTVPAQFDTSDLLAAAVERRVAYVPGAAFYPDGSGRDKMRLAFCYAAEKDIDEGVRRLADLLAEEAELYRSLGG